MTKPVIVDFPISVDQGSKTGFEQGDLFTELDGATSPSEQSEQQAVADGQASEAPAAVATGGLARALRAVPDLPSASEASHPPAASDEDDEPNVHADLGGGVRGTESWQQERRINRLKNQLPPETYSLIPQIDDDAIDADSSMLPQEEIYLPDSDQVDVAATQAVRIDAVLAILEAPMMDKIPRSKEARREAARSMDDETVGIRTLFMQAYGCGYLEYRRGSRNSQEAFVYRRLLERFEKFYKAFAGEQSVHSREVAIELLTYRKQQLLQSTAKSA